MRKLFVALLAAWLLPVAALAADLGPPIVNWGGENEKPGPVQQVGYDSVSGSPCIVGKTATCSPPAAALPTGAATAANQATQITAEQTTATAQGAQGTGYNPPSGGSGVLGFLSGIYHAVTNTLNVQLQAGSAIAGKFGIDQTTPGTTNGVVVNSTVNPATIYSAQQTVTTSAIALVSQALSNGLVITADLTNSAAIYVGPSGVTTSTGYKLQPGASISYGVTNANAIYIVSAASTTDKIAVTGN